MSLLVGSLAASIAALLTAWQADSLALLGVGLLIAATAIVRAFDMRAYQGRAKAEVEDRATIRRWEVRYVTGATIYLALLGTWALVAFIVTDDPSVRLLSFAGTVAYLVGTSGRNFASDLLVISQIIGAGVPLCLALVVGGGFYYVMLVLLLLPLLYSLRLNANRLRKTLLDAVIATREITLLAARFDTALNNMPHGLAMFDSDRRLLVANGRLSEILGVLADSARKGASVRDLVSDAVNAGVVLRAEAEDFASEFENHLAGEPGRLLFETPKGRTLDMTFQAMEKGGSVVLVEDITERMAAEARIRHLARYDALTNLPNRITLREEMDRAMASVDKVGPFAIHFVDLDHFKQVNDTLGHPRGDALLRQVSDRLRLIVGRNDVVARFGGDEFVVLQPGVRDRKQAEKLASRIVAKLSEIYEVDGHQVAIGASVGIALAPADGTGDQLLKNADMALYWAKADQRGTLRFFEGEMDVRAQARRELELDLRSALASNAFDVYYQPLFNLKTRKISTCEALLRWPHPLRGMISPVEFIPVAEEMGLIVEIGSWVLHQACLACATWPNGVRVAVNLSANQLRRGNIVETIRDAISAAGLAPGRLEIEITESVLFEDTGATRATLKAIRDMGVRISLDDFGTGYSSLSYLHSLPLNKVKIDRSFLNGLDSDERALILIEGIARLSVELGLSVAVEGIETMDQLTLLSSEPAIEEAQGFLFSPAIPGREIYTLLMATPSRIEKIARAS